MNDLFVLQPSRPTRSDALKNHDLLLQTAIRLIDEHGVDAVTMSAVAEAAGVGKGTLYRHFPSKSQLLVELLDGDQRDLQKRTFAFLREHAGCPTECLNWFLGEALMFVERNRPLLSTVAVYPLAAGMDHPAHLWWRLTIRGLLVQVGGPSDIDYRADVLYTLLDPRVVHYLRVTRGYSVERVLTGLLDTAALLTS